MSTVPIVKLSFCVSVTSLVRTADVETYGHPSHPLLCFLSVIFFLSSSPVSGHPDTLASTPPASPRHTSRIPPVTMTTTPRPDANLPEAAAATSAVPAITQRAPLDGEFDCPRGVCQCYLLMPQNQVWLNCTLPSLDNSAEQRATLRDIPVTRSAFLMLT